MNHKTIAKHLGIKIDPKGDPKELCNWDGTKINAKGMSEDGMIHEISHWVLASEEMRKIPDYGLGPGPSTKYQSYENALRKMDKTPRDFWGRDDVDEEILTCVLEFCYSAMCGENMTWLMRDRNFLEPNRLKWESEDISLHIKVLQEKGIIDRYWVPKGIKELVKPLHRKRLKEFRELVRSIP